MLSFRNILDVLFTMSSPLYVSRECVTNIIFLIPFLNNFAFCSLWVFLISHCDYLFEHLHCSLICGQDCESLQNIAIVWSEMLMINEFLIVGMFHAIVLYMLHHWIFVDFFRPAEGLQHCYIVYKDWLLWWISSHFSGYVHLSTTPHTCWTAMIYFSLQRVKNIIPCCDFMSADALLHLQQSQPLTTGARFGFV